MTETRVIMGMPITIEIADAAATPAAFTEMFDYFISVDERFSTYKKDSEIMRINRGEIIEKNYSAEMREILALAEETKKKTSGYFDIEKPDGTLDPSGVVKGWAIRNAADILQKKGFRNFFVDAGGDIQALGHNSERKEWSVGIRNPFVHKEIVKIVYPRGQGMATSGTYVRGQHIYNPHEPGKQLQDIISLTVIGPGVMEADLFATGAFAMGREGINFIERAPGFEGYSIDNTGRATMTSGFESYTRTMIPA